MVAMKARVMVVVLDPRIEKTPGIVLCARGESPDSFPATQIAGKTVSLFKVELPFSRDNGAKLKFQPPVREVAGENKPTYGVAPRPQGDANTTVLRGNEQFRIFFVYVPLLWKVYTDKINLTRFEVPVPVFDGATPKMRVEYQYWAGPDVVVETDPLDLTPTGDSYSLKLARGIVQATTTDDERVVLVVGQSGDARISLTGLRNADFEGITIRVQIQNRQNMRGAPRDERGATTWFLLSGDSGLFDQLRANQFVPAGTASSSVGFAMGSSGDMVPPEITTTMLRAPSADSADTDTSDIAVFDSRARLSDTHTKVVFYPRDMVIEWDTITQSLFPSERQVSWSVKFPPALQNTFPLAVQCERVVPTSMLEFFKSEVDGRWEQSDPNPTSVVVLRHKAIREVIHVRVVELRQEVPHIINEGEVKVDPEKVISWKHGNTDAQAALESFYAPVLLPLGRVFSTFSKMVGKPLDGPPAQYLADLSANVGKLVEAYANETTALRRMDMVDDATVPHYFMWVLENAIAGVLRDCKLSLDYITLLTTESVGSISSFADLEKRSANKDMRESKVDMRSLLAIVNPDNLELDVVNANPPLFDFMRFASGVEIKVLAERDPVYRAALKGWKDGQVVLCKHPELIGQYMNKMLDFELTLNSPLNAQYVALNGLVNAFEYGWQPFTTQYTLAFPPRPMADDMKLPATEVVAANSDAFRMAVLSRGNVPVQVRIGNLEAKQVGVFSRASELVGDGIDAVEFRVLVPPGCPVSNDLHQARATPRTANVVEDVHQYMLLLEKLRFGFTLKDGYGVWKTRDQVVARENDFDVVGREFDMVALRKFRFFSTRPLPGCSNSVTFLVIPSYDSQKTTDVSFAAYAITWLAAFFGEQIRDGADPLNAPRTIAELGTMQAFYGLLLKQGSYLTSVKTWEGGKDFLADHSTFAVGHVGYMGPYSKYIMQLADQLQRHARIQTLSDTTIGPFKVQELIKGADEDTEMTLRCFEYLREKSNVNVWVYVDGGFERSVVVEREGGLWPLDVAGARHSTAGMWYLWGEKESTGQSVYLYWGADSFVVPLVPIGNSGNSAMRASEPGGSVVASEYKKLYETLEALRFTYRVPVNNESFLYHRGLWNYQPYQSRFDVFPPSMWDSDIVGLKPSHARVYPKVLDVLGVSEEVDIFLDAAEFEGEVDCVTLPAQAPLDPPASPNGEEGDASGESEGSTEMIGPGNEEDANDPKRLVASEAEAWRDSLELPPDVTTLAAFERGLMACSKCAAYVQDTGDPELGEFMAKVEPAYLGVWQDMLASDPAIVAATEYAEYRKANGNAPCFGDDFALIDKLARVLQLMQGESASFPQMPALHSMVTQTMVYWVRYRDLMELHRCEAFDEFWRTPVWHHQRTITRVQKPDALTPRNYEVALSLDTTYPENVAKLELCVARVHDHLASTPDLSIQERTVSKVRAFKLVSMMLGSREEGRGTHTLVSGFMSYSKAKLGLHALPATLDEVAFASLRQCPAEVGGPISQLSDNPGLAAVLHLKTFVAINKAIAEAPSTTGSLLKSLDIDIAKRLEPDDAVAAARAALGMLENDPSVQSRPMNLQLSAPRAQHAARRVPDYMQRASFTLLVQMLLGEKGVMKRLSLTRGYDTETSAELVSMLQEIHTKGQVAYGAHWATHRAKSPELLVGVDPATVPVVKVPGFVSPVFDATNLFILLTSGVFMETLALKHIDVYLEKLNGRPVDASFARVLALHQAYTFGSPLVTVKVTEPIAGAAVSLVRASMFLDDNAGQLLCVEPIQNQFVAFEDLLAPVKLSYETMVLPVEFLGKPRHGLRGIKTIPDRFTSSGFTFKLHRLVDVDGNIWAFARGSLSVVYTNKAGVDVDTLRLKTYCERITRFSLPSLHFLLYLQTTSTPDPVPDISI